MAKTRQLELEDDPAFQRIDWRMQRVGWILWGIILVAGLSGLMGTGPLSSAETAAPDKSVTLRYHRFLHYHKPTRLEIVLRPEEQGQTLRLKVSRSLLDRIEVLRIEPQPKDAVLTSDGVVYSFDRDDSLESGKILFHVEYEKYGKTSGQIALLGHQPATFKQFVYP